MPSRILVQSLLFSACIGLFLAPVYAQDEKTRQLLKRLKQPVPAYQPPTVKNAVPPHLLAKQGYEVSWLKAPYLRFSDAELQRAKTVIVQMVIANTGRITDVEIIQSSGLRVVDAKITAAVLAAKLEPIKGVDHNLVYIVKLLYYSYRIRKKLEITHRLSRSTILYAYV
ncbi:hypothetical protein Asch01_03137 [Acinetobacter schindleri]|uniref:energy transducer TonB n=1 Tax=Acinetobacter schindleri TaxID=108981 RepID=UPI0030A9816B